MPPHENKQETFIVDCNGELFKEQKIPELDMNVLYNAQVAASPVGRRYIIHCLVKGWTPSVRGLLGFMRLLALGYYKTL